MKYIFYIIVSICAVISIYFLTKCDINCTELKKHDKELYMKQQIEREKIDSEYNRLQQNYQNELEKERQKNTVTVYRETEQVIKDRLIEKGTDIGINIGLRLLGF